MSTTQVERPVKVHSSCVKSLPQDQEKHHNRRNTVNSGISASKKNKYDEGRFKFGRKRSQSCSTGNGKFFIPYKKRKREGIVPPTKFLLGGNIFDPLNLNSLQDEEINRAMNAVTPKSSPLPTPKHRKGEVEVLIPPNINDPLNLINCDDDAKYEQQLVSPTKKRSKKKKKKRNSSSSKDDSMETANTTGSGIDESMLTEEKELIKESVGSIESATAENKEQCVGKEVRDLRKDLELPLKDDEKKCRKSFEENSKDSSKNEKKIRKVDLKDKIVSPVIPQPGAWKGRPPHGHRGGGNMGAPDGRFNRFRQGHHWQKNRDQNLKQMPKFQEKNTKFQYGNYNRYYGYRNPSHDTDTRLKYFQRRKELFYDKDVLDIGCNIGHITLSIARDFGAKSVVGLDIDRSLIEIARVNIRHYVNYSDSPPNEGTNSRFFPISMPILYGPVDIPGITKSESPSVNKKFPHNVSFVQGNYVLESDVLLQTEQPQFDVIFALSITKWIHLNWGDAGMKRAFKRMYAQLRPGGKLILEAQAWDSYKKKKSLTETIYKNYNTIEFFPDKFTQYLLSTEVGFSKCEHIGSPFHISRGFQRPIQLFTKGESPTHSAPSTSNTPFYSTTSSSIPRLPVYTSVVGSNQETDSGGATPAPMDVSTHNPNLTASETVTHIPVYTPVGTSYVDDGSEVKVDIGSEQQGGEAESVESQPTLGKKRRMESEENDSQTTVEKKVHFESAILQDVEKEPSSAEIPEKMECETAEQSDVSRPHSSIETDNTGKGKSESENETEHEKSIISSTISRSSKERQGECKEAVENQSSICSVQSGVKGQLSGECGMDTRQDETINTPDSSLQTDNLS